MKLSTRLMLPLIAAVSLVMLAYATWSLRQREAFMVAEAERETRAYATALGLALERAVGQTEAGAVQEMIDRIDREPSIYGVVVYDTLGAALYVSSPLASAPPATPAEVRAAIPRGTATTLRREVLGEESVIIFRPLIDEDGVVRGVVEVVQPLGSVTAQLERTRLRFILNTVTLVLAVTLLLTWLIGRHLSAPLDRFVEAVRALGGGELSHRIEADIAVGELAAVAGELNRMADRLEETRNELVREAEERVSLERRLLQSEKLAEVGRLAAGLAHEIGAPLHVIRGRADLLLKGMPEASARERNLGIIIQQIDRIAVIVRNLLGYARRREPRIAHIDLLAVVHAVIEFLDSEVARGGAELSVASSVDALPVRGDADLLYQVFLNVALNALHALEESERPAVTLRVGRERVGERDLAVVEIEDNGPGIPAELRDRVFEPFYTTKSARHGTGLGLALARAIVEDHSGVIAVLPPSAERWSTRVRVELPADATERGDAAAAPAAAPAAVGAAGRG